MADYHLRRKDKQITDPEKLIKPLIEADYITLSLCMENKPYIVTLSHVYDPENNCVYFHSAREGKKIDYLRSNPVVWGQAIIDNGYQQGSCDHLYHSTQFSGETRFIENIVEKRHALTLMIRKLDDNPEEIIVDQLMSQSIAKVHIGRIDIKEMTGKKADRIIISL
jgi:nitroimidazol reductase NimA-like FMN-containing flavoprotein (pyridoxamine 5'-phosphate oxidase superfamily)